MIRKQPRYSEEFQRAVVDAVLSGEKIASVAQAHGISPGSVHNWLKRFAKGTPDRKSPVKTRRQFSDREKENAVELVEEGTPVMEVADLVGATPRSIYDWMQQLRPEQYRADQLAGKLEAALAEKRLQQAREQRSEAERKMAQEQVEQFRAKTEEAARAKEMLMSALGWMQGFTKTKDSHWSEAGALSPYRPMPDRPYFRVLADGFQQEAVIFMEKSRDMMLSWLSVGLFTHAAMSTAGIEVLFQSQKLDKACELVEYARTLYEQSDEAIRKTYPLAKGVQASGELVFANDSRIVAIPGGADQIRSYHPWGLLMDEAAFMPEAADSYNNAVPVCQKIVVLSSAGPGWFADVCGSAAFSTALVRGVMEKRVPQGVVFRVHYTADRERDPAVNSGWVVAERRKYSTQGAWDREQEIIHEAGAGERLFAEILSRWADKILIDPYESGFRASPHWKRISGFDHGKANPTAALVASVDFDGVIYVLSEYYQPGLSPRQHRPNLEQLYGFRGSEAVADPSIFYKTQAQVDGTFKAIADLYVEEGILNLAPAPSNSELTGMERILNHWLDLDEREPTLKIVCPRNKRDIGRPVYGIHNDGCPNLLWELKRARREELGSAQLVYKNPTERIVDKDNHLRDCLKYLCLALPEATVKPAMLRAQEAVRGLDATSAMIRWNQIIAESEKEDAPIVMGRRGMRNLGRMRKNGY